MIPEPKKYVCGEDVSDNGAFPNSCVLEYVLRIPRYEGVRKAELTVHEDEYRQNFREWTYDFHWIDMDEGCDIYVCSLNLENLKTGLYFINIKTEKKDGVDFVYSRNDYHRQLTVYDRDFETPRNNGGMMYHIFVDRFYRSGKSNIRNDSVFNPDWENGIPQYGDHPGDSVLNNVFFGGDLYGIAEKMSYIAELGAEYIYLSPIFEAFSNHKYDTGDYLRVDESFGGDDALRCLIDEADKYGIKIILDGVFNHTGADSLYFNKYRKYLGKGAYNSKQSPYSEWYNFRHFPDDYECWWNIKTLPRVNSRNKNYIDFIAGENSVVGKWMDFGIGGWRLDVADELSDEFLMSFRAAVKRHDPSAIIIGEVWENASNKISYGVRRKYFLGGQLDGVMNYPLRNALISLIKYNSVEEFIRMMKILIYQYPNGVINCLMNTLGTHDTERIITILAGNEEDPNNNERLAHLKMTPAQRKKGIEAVKKAFGILYFLPGIPCVFYGDEIGMEGYHDPFCRMPFRWNETENNDLLKYLKKLGRIRRKYKALAEGELKFEYDDKYSFILSRESSDEKIFLIFNSEKGNISVKFDKPAENILTGRKYTSVSPKQGDFVILRTGRNIKMTCN